MPHPIDDFTEEMIKHLQEHPELLEQRQGMDIMQNFFVINPQERQVTFKDVMLHVKKNKQKILDQGNLRTPRAEQIIKSHIDIVDDILETFPDDESNQLELRGLDIPEMRKLIVKNAAFIALSLTILIKDYEKDIETVPAVKEELQVLLDSAYHVLLDFSILLKIKFPTSTPYLRELKEKYKID